MDYPPKPAENVSSPSEMFLTLQSCGQVETEAIEFLKSGSTEFLRPDPSDRQDHDTTTEHPTLFESEEEVVDDEEIPLAQVALPKKRGRKPSAKFLDAKKAAKDSEDIEEPWVQCDRCAKWRKLENQWNKKQFSCSQLGISCEEECDCDPPCDCKNNARKPPQDPASQPLAKLPRTIPRPKKRMTAKATKSSTSKNASEDSHSSDSESGVRPLISHIRTCFRVVPRKTTLFIAATKNMILTVIMWGVRPT